MPHGNLLIVDDEPVLLKQMKANLEDVADQIFVASNGEDALHVLKAEKVHCVVCDINMPKMNGLEMVRRLRAGGNKLPVIFYSGHGDDALRLEASQFGSFDFLDKPDLIGLETVVARGLRAGMGEEQVEDRESMGDEFDDLLK